MKKFIAQKNAYLLENHPVLWNTRILWVVAGALLIHALFFLMGIGSVVDPASLHKSNTLENFFSNGAVFLSIMISILLLVVWLIYLFKNNSFKNYYPTSAWDLFKNFICYAVIIFISITFYYSYTLGVQSYVLSVHDEEKTQSEIALANDAAMFFSHKIYNYTLDQRTQPHPFDTLYCETNSNAVALSKPHLSFLDKNYQFFNYRTLIKENNADYVDSIYNGSIFQIENEQTTTYYYKNKIVDVTPYVDDALPSYYNFSDIFYRDGDGFYYDYEQYGYKGYLPDANDRNIVSKHKPYILIQARRNYELLERNDDKEIQELLSSFIELTEDYSIDRNLDGNSWFNLVSKPGFKVEHFIANSYATATDRDSYYMNYDNNEDLDPIVKFIEERETPYYIETSDLKNSFENIYDIRTTNIFEGSIHFFIWLTLFFSMLVFVFRTTGLKSLLFSIIGAGLLFVLIALFFAVYQYVVGGYVNSDLVMMYSVFILGTIILLVTFFALDKLKKIIASLFMNITLVGMIPYLFLILGIIDTHQRNVCNARPYVPYELREPCDTILNALDVGWSYLFMILALVFVYFYSKHIIKWRALPEG